MDSPLANKQWERYTWTPGEEITDVKLNAIEQKLEDLHGPAMHAIRYDIDQDLTEEEKRQVKKNFNITSTVGSHAMGENDKNKAYILGTTTAPVENDEVTATMVADPGVYLDTDSGSLTITGAFSQGRKANTEVGMNSFASGWNVEASGFFSHAKGLNTIAAADQSYAEGFYTEARSTNAHAEGQLSKALGINSHAEGSKTQAVGANSHAECDETFTYGDCSHAEGMQTSAIGKYSHVEGEGGTIKKGVIKLTGDEDEDTYTFDALPSNMSNYDNTYHYYLFYKNKYIGVRKIYPANHKIVLNSTLFEALDSKEVDVYAFPTVAFGNGSHAEGYHTVAQGQQSHAEGSDTVAEEQNSHAEGDGTRAGMSAHAEGSATIAEGPYSHSEGSTTKAKGISSHTEGADTLAEGQNAHAEGETTVAKGKSSHVEGTKTVAIGNSAHAEGVGLNTRTSTIVLTGASKATTYTYNTLPGGFFSNNIEFYYILNNTRYYLITNINEQKKQITLQQTLSSSAITSKTFNIYAFDGVASGVGAHSEGEYTAAAGEASHAEGGDTSATGNRSHAEGDLSRARGAATHAEGHNTEASGVYSHAEGEGTATTHKSQHVFGRYNNVDSSTNSVYQYGNYVEIVGNGTDDTRSNARTLDWNGNEWLAGTLTAKNIDGTSGRMVDVFIQGTQGDKTAAWKGNAPFSALHDGQIISYWLPVASASSSVTLELTLTNGTSLTTGAIPVYINGTTRVKDHIPANNIIVMVYRENVAIKNSSGVASNYTGWWILRSQDTTTNTYDRTQYKMDVISAEAIPQATIGVFNRDHKLIKLAENAAFDITKPILYVSTAYAAADEKKITNYIQYGAPFDFTQMSSGVTSAAGDTVYIEGTLSGIMFKPLKIIAGTPSSSTAHTYILLGHLSTATKMCLPAEHPFFGFKNNVFTRI
jgi:hypothetical protein